MPHSSGAQWREEAPQIIDYISDRNPAAAVRLADLFKHYAERLADLPFMHRPGRVADTREAIITPNYILVYRVTGDVVKVLNVNHTRQHYP